MVTSDWYKEDNNTKWYYAKANGQLATQWYKPDKYYRYFRSSDGLMATGWHKIGDSYYYLRKSDGARCSGEFQLGGSLYYCASDGKRYESTWINGSDSNKYYAKADGTLAVGLTTIGGKKYYFGNDGAQKTGWQTINGKQYYFSKTKGYMATSIWEDDDHYVGADGAYIPGYVEKLFRWPLTSNWNYISSYFGGRESPGGIGSTNHQGIDIPADYGTPIYAAEDGICTVRSYQEGGAGYYIMINHTSISSGTSTIYMHMSRFADVYVGDRVKKGQVIGYVGSTGASTGNHLHFGVQINGEYEDPLDYVNVPE